MTNLTDQVVTDQPAIRPELEPLPERMKDLPVDQRGYVVPWFVEWVDGPDGVKVPEFRATSGRKMAVAHRSGVCWVCGKKLGAFKCFVIGPMCGINRVSSEPPSHLECAQWSARNCPFLSRPHMVRREDEFSEKTKGNMAGVGILRNPGVTLLWITKSYKLIPDGAGRVLFGVGEPERVEWYAEGRPAKREEIEESVRTGLPIIEDLARQERGGMDEVARRKLELEVLYPPQQDPAPSAGGGGASTKKEGQ